MPTTTNLAEALPSNTAHVESPSSERASKYAGRDGVEVKAPCPRCFGTGLEVVPDKGARRCGCRSEDSRRRLLESARIPRRYEGCTLLSYRPAPGNARNSSPSILRSGRVPVPGRRPGPAARGPVRRR